MFRNIFDLSSHILISLGLLLIGISFLLIILPELLSWFIAFILLSGGIYVLLLGIKSKKISNNQNGQYIV